MGRLQNLESLFNFQDREAWGPGIFPEFQDKGNLRSFLIFQGREAWELGSFLNFQDREI